MELSAGVAQLEEQDGVALDLRERQIELIGDVVIPVFVPSRYYSPRLSLSGSYRCMSSAPRQPGELP